MNLFCTLPAHNKKRGHSLIEVIVGLGIFMILVPGVITLSMGSYTDTLRSEKKLIATGFAQQAIEATRAIRNQSWEALTPGQYGLSKSSGVWDLDGTHDRIHDTYDRHITISERNAYTKEVTVTVDWNVTKSIQNSITLTSWFTNWGSNTWVQSSQADFEAGSFNTITAQNGTLTLEQAGDIDTIDVIKNINFPGSADILSAHIDHNTLYLTTTSDSQYGEFIAIDISDQTRGKTTIIGDTDLFATAYSADVANGYAYVTTNTDNAELRIIRLSDMQEVNQIDIPGTSDTVSVTVKNDIAYISRTEEWSGYWDWNLWQWIEFDEFFAYDISTPEGTVDQRGATKLNEDVNDFVLKDTYAILATSDTREIQVIDLNTFTVVAQYDLPGDADALTIKRDGDWAFVGRDGGWTDEVYKLNIQNPLAITTENSIDLDNDAVQGMDIHTGKVFLALENYGESESVIIDADSLDIIKKLDHFNYYNSSAIAASGRFVYATSYYDADTLQIWTGGSGGWTDPERVSIVNLDDYEWPDVTGLVVDGAYAFVTTYYNGGGNDAELYILDIQDPYNPSIIGSYDVDEDVYDLAIQGDRAYLATGGNRSELMIVDISQKSSPRLLGTYDTPRSKNAYAVAAQGTTVFLGTDKQNGRYPDELFVLDVSNPQDINLLESLDTKDRIYDLDIDEDILAIATRNNTQEVILVDISNPKNLSVLDTFNTEKNGDAYAVNIADDLLVVGLQDNGKRDDCVFLNISTPRTIKKISGLDIGDVNDIAIKDDILFVVSDKGQEELSLWNIADRTNPQQISAYSNDWWEHTAVAVQGDFVFVGSTPDDKEVQIFGPSKTSSPLARLGIFTSLPFDSEETQTDYTKFSWTQGGTGTVKCQIRTAATKTGLEHALWVGSEGHENSFYGVPDLDIIEYPSATGRRWIQYRCILEGDGITAPTIENVSIEYQ